MALGYHGLNILSTLKDNNLEMKDVGKSISDIARKFYLNKINAA